MKKLIALVMLLAMLCTCVPFALAEDPIVVNVIPPSSATGSSAEGYKMVQDWILKETGVLVNAYTLDGTDDTNQKNALLMGDTRIDIWWGSAAMDWSYWKEMGMIRPINRFLELAPSAVAAWEKYNAMGLVTDLEGNIWGLPRNVDRVFYQTFIREDFMKALGYTEDQYPTTFEAFEEYLYKVQAAAGTNGIPENVIPMITRNNMTTMEYHFLGGFTEHGYSNWMDEDGTIKPYYLADGYYDFLVKMNQWYKDGIINAENPSWSTNQVKEYLASGRVAASGAYSTDLCNQYINLRTNVPEAKWWASVNGMTRNGELCESQIKGDSAAMMLNKNTPDEVAEAYFKVLEFLHSDWANNYSSQVGLQGLYWDYDTETYGEEAKTLHIVKTLDSAASQPKYTKDFWFSIGLPTEADCVMYDADGVQNMQNEYIRHQGDTFAAKPAFDKGVAYNDGAIRDAVMMYNDLKTAIAEETEKFYMGQEGYELTEENWNNFIQRLYDEFELQEYCDELTRQYKLIKGL